MINIVDMQKSLVLAWVTKLMQPSYEKWKAFPQYLSSQLGKQLYCFTSSVIQCQLRNVLGFRKNSILFLETTAYAMA